MQITSRAVAGVLAAAGLALSGVGVAAATGTPATPSSHSSTVGSQQVQVAAKSAIHANAVTSTFKTCWRFHGTQLLPVQLGLAPGQPVAVTATEAGDFLGNGEGVGDAVIRVDNVATQSPNGLVVARVEVSWPTDLFVCTHYLW